MENTCGFVHLHTHTMYSLLDGAIKPNDYINAALEWGMGAAAMTDHGNMFGAIEFYVAAKDANVKPVIGCELYIAPGDRRDRETRGFGDETNYHLLLLAENETGYQNLVKLTSIGYTEGFYYKPRIDKETLRAFSEGVIATSACLGGEVTQALMKRDRATAKKVVEEYASIFGPERFFIELQNHGMPEQLETNPVLVELANEVGLGTVAANDVH